VNLNPSPPPAPLFIAKCAKCGETDPIQLEPVNRDTELKCHSCGGTSPGAPIGI
jgi:translation initiation factor 2 beta subunit (eIF-2beta)/eIF-5